MSHATDRAASSTTTPVLWLCGPPGVGKTTVGWEIYSQLKQTGATAGYVDIDQLGISYPESADDPERHELKAENLDTVVAAFQTAGAQRVVVSGVVDPVRGMHADKIPHATLTICRLRADGDELARRLTARQGNDRQVTESLAAAAAMDTAEIGDVCIDTTGLPVAETVQLIHQRTAGWLTPAEPRPPVRPTAHPPGTGSGPVLWLCGATGVGKSSVGFSIYATTTFGRKVPGAYLDLDQIGFLSPAPPDDPMNHRVKARILADLWRAYQVAGAKTLTIVGPAEDDEAIKIYKQVLPATPITMCRLHAGPETLIHRILLRRHGGSWAQPGDPLRGQTEEHLLAVAEQAAKAAKALESAAIGDTRIDTDGLTTDQVADAVLARTGWPPL